MNSKRKGKVGELEFASLLRENGFMSRRGQQFSGNPDAPDVISDDLKWIHIEVKRVQHLNLTDACAQAEGDCGGKPWIVAHRRNHAPWLITMKAEVFFDLVNGVLPPNEKAEAQPRTGGVAEAGDVVFPVTVIMPGAAAVASSVWLADKSCY